MENIQEQQIVPLKEKKKGSLKFKVYLVLFVFLIGVGVYGYYWATTTQQLRNEAQANVEKINQYDVLQNEIQTERSRCETFISQEQGDFGSFEYCKKFIQWSNNK